MFVLLDTKQTQTNKKNLRLVVFVYIYSLHFTIRLSLKTSLLRRLQAQTLPDAASPIGKVHPFNKIAVTLEPVMRFDALRHLEFPKKMKYSLYYD